MPETANRMASRLAEAQLTADFQPGASSEMSFALGRTKLSSIWPHFIPFGKWTVYGGYGAGMLNAICGGRASCGRGLGVPDFQQSLNGAWIRGWRHGKSVTRYS